MKRPMASKKKKRRRKTFNMPTEGPLFESDDEWMVASPEGLPPDAPMPPDQPMPSEDDMRAQHMEMLRSVFAFETLVWRGFKTILFSILFFSVGTSLAGGFLGWAFPNYCRFVLGAFDRVDFKPWIGGLGHGLVYGALAGAVIGCVVVFSAAIYQSRSWKNLKEQSEA